MITQKHVYVLLAFVAVCGVPFLPGIPAYWFTLLNYIGIFWIVAMGLVVLTGLAGMTSLGQAMFMAIGAYATAIGAGLFHISPWLTLPMSIVATAVVAWLIGMITTRLSGHYLALATIAWNVSFFFLLGSIELFGRYDGISGIPPVTLFGIPFFDGSRIFYLIFAFLGLSVVLTQNLLNSRDGRAIRALRGGAIAAKSCGVDIGRAKIVAFIYASALAGLAGWLYAHTLRTVSPSPFSLNASIEYLLMTVVGGAASIWGAILGATIITILKDLLQDILPLISNSGGSLEIVFFGLMLLALLQVAPEGLWPNIARWFRLPDIQAFGTDNSGGVKSQPMTTLPTFLTADELAAILRCQPEKVYRLAAHGELPSYKVQGRRLFDENEVAQWLRTRQVGRAGIFESP